MTKVVQVARGFDMDGDATMLFQTFDENGDHVRYLSEDEINEEVLSRLERVLARRSEPGDREWLQYCFDFGGVRDL